MQDSNVLVQRNTLEAILFFFPFYTALVRGLLWDGPIVCCAPTSVLPKCLNFQPSKSRNFWVSCVPSIWGVEETLLLFRVFRNYFTGTFGGYLGQSLEKLFHRDFCGDIWDVLEVAHVEKKYSCEVYSSRILEFRILELLKYMKLFLLKPRGENLT